MIGIRPFLPPKQLPLALQPRLFAPGNAPAEDHEGSTGERGIVPGVRILVVEDDDLVRNYLKIVLVRAGYDVTGVSDGCHAIPILERESIAVVISDVMMPKINGGQLLAEVRRLRPEAKVIFISGYSGDVISRQGIHTGEFTFLQKPVLKDDILSAVASVLAG